MISKERLEELIEQGATIYSTHWKEEVDLSQKCEVVKKSFYDGKKRLVLIVHEDEEHSPHYMLENLTEDVEGAKWEEEFGCIERTERLELPNWKKLKCVIKGLRKRKLEFDCTCVYSFSIKDKVYRLFFCKSEDDYTIELILDDDVPLLNLQLTEENYIKACKVAKEKFLGEKK